MFSNRENKILKIIGRRKITIDDICMKLFMKDDEPFEPNISVSNAIRRINKKCEFYKLDWSLNKIRKDKKLFIKRGKK